MKIGAFLLALASLSFTGPARAAGDPCAAAADASPLAASRGRLVVTRDIASYVARHAEIACARLGAISRETAAAASTQDDEARKAAVAAGVRTIQGELETGVLAPIFRLYPELAGRDLTAADAPGAAVKIGPFGTPQRPPSMGFATAQHLHWVSGDADRRFAGILKLVSDKPPADGAPPPDAAAKKRGKAMLSVVEDALVEIDFIGAPAQRDYPDLWKVRKQELAKRAPKGTRTAKGDADFRAGAPPPGSVKLSEAAAAKIRAFDDAMRHEPGCHVLSLAWYLSSGSRGPDDAAWHETGPGIGLGAWSCGQVPPDVVRTVGGIRLVFGGDKDHSFTGKTVDFVDKHFVVR